MKKPLTRAELEDLHSMLRRAAERAERRKRAAEGRGVISTRTDDEAEWLARAVAALADDLAGCR